MHILAPLCSPLEIWSPWVGAGPRDLNSNKQLVYGSHFANANIKNKFPVSLLPLPDYALEALSIGATLAYAQEIPLFVGMGSALG